MSRNSVNAKVAITELYFRWQTLAASETYIRSCIDEAIAAAQPSAAHHVAADASPPSPHPQSPQRASRSSGSSTGSAAGSDHPLSAFAGAGAGGNAMPGGAAGGAAGLGSSSTNLSSGGRTPSPVHMSTRFLGVDEIDMANVRAHSPGGASPISPNLAIHRLSGSGGSVPSDALHLPMHPERPASPVSPSSGSVNSLPPSKSPVHFPLLSLPSPSSGAGGGSSGAHSPSYAQRGGGFGDSHGGLLGSSGGGGTPSGNSSMNHSQVLHASLSAGHMLATASELPRFYHPYGAPYEPPADELEALQTIFGRKPPPPGKQRHGSNDHDISATKGLKRATFGRVLADVFHLPAWFRDVVFRRVLHANGVGDSGPNTTVTLAQVERFYQAHIARLTPNRRLFEALRGDAKRDHLNLGDLIACTRQLVEHHPGLTFLTQPEFQELYCKTAALRMLYSWERNQNGTIAWRDFDRSDIPDVMRALDRVTDINQLLCYFTYEHFYVLYCRFWELDTDRDYLLSLTDLQNYSQGSLTPAALERVVSGCGRRLSSTTPKKLDFEDFVYFCLSEEDKNSAPAVLYWFKVADVDQDGVLSGHEMERFFKEQRPRFQQLSPEEIRFDDMLCQMMDMIGTNRVGARRDGLTLADLKKCPTVSHLFNMLFNATKFMAFEHRDPFAEHHQKQQPEKTDWDRFARAEYDRMASEATA